MLASCSYVDFVFRTLLEETKFAEVWSTQSVSRWSSSTWNQTSHDQSLMLAALKTVVPESQAPAVTSKSKIQISPSIIVSAGPAGICCDRMLPKSPISDGLIDCEGSYNSRTHTHILEIPKACLSQAKNEIIWNRHYISSIRLLQALLQGTSKSSEISLIPGLNQSCLTAPVTLKSLLHVVATIDYPRYL